MARMTGGTALVKSLRAHGIDTMFGIPGVQLDHFFNAMHDERNAIRFIQNRHEQGGGYMAFGYAASSGKVGAYAVVPGPGFLNSSAALSTAYACNAPVLCITGQVASDKIDRRIGSHHEINDQLGTIRSLTKWADRMEHPTAAPGLVETAFRELRSGRIRPVGLEAAPDVFAMEADVELRDPLPAPPPLAPDPNLIEVAAKLLGAAERPLILSGRGVFGACEELLAVAEMLQAPVSMSRNGKGAIPGDHYIGIAESVGHRLYAEADVVLAVGTRMYEQYYGWGVDKGVKIIRIDVDPTEIGRSGKPAVGIAADARLALAALANAIPKHNRKRDSRKDELNTRKAELQLEFEKLSPQWDYISVLREELPKDGFVVGESTQMAYMVRIGMPFYHPRTYVSPGYQGTLGYGFPTSLGVKVANPDKEVVSISGDGGFLFGGSELSTAVQHRIGTVTLVFNDGAYGNVKRSQVHKYGNRVIGTDLHNPDFVKYAESFGAQGLKATNPAELRAALKQSFGRDLPTLIEIPVGELPSPWHLMHLPRVRG
ncbi:MAG: thiamine pyrophosphate-binding protein [Proteobacteria bacterium]|nr:thiamine pyrophosphate-binding protein [Pseudomonadota bacterium]